MRIALKSSARQSPCASRRVAICCAWHLQRYHRCNVALQGPDHRRIRRHGCPQPRAVGGPVPAMTAISPQRRSEIIDALRAGAVPAGVWKRWQSVSPISTGLSGKNSSRFAQVAANSRPFAANTAAARPSSPVGAGARQATRLRDLRSADFGNRDAPPPPGNRLPAADGAPLDRIDGIGRLAVDCRRLVLHAGRGRSRQRRSTRPIPKGSWRRQNALMQSRLIPNYRSLAILCRRLAWLSPSAPLLEDNAAADALLSWVAGQPNVGSQVHPGRRIAGRDRPFRRAQGACRAC